MSMTDASAEYFESVAGEWDRLRSGYFTEAVRDAAIARAYLRPEMVVADVGTGTGFVAAGLAPLVTRVYALDGSPAMLDIARRNLAVFGNVTYQVTDGSRLPLEDASVDAVFANMYLHHCPVPAAAIREMARVLRPGGRLMLTDMDRHEHEWMRQEMADEWLGFERGQVKAWLREAGLVNVIVDCTSQSCCAKSEADPSRDAEISVFVATGSRRVAGAREAVQANYGAVAEGAFTEGSACGCSVDAPAGSSSCCSPSATEAWVADAAAAPASCCAATASPISLSIPESFAAPAACCGASNAMGDVEAAIGEGSIAADGLTWHTGYSAEQLAAVPAEAAQLSLGCGNPTAIAGLKPGEAVLDIGSGAGIDAFYAARRVGPAGKVIGLDMTPAMIERARRSAEAAGLSQAEFRLGNAEAMPIEDGTVDVVLSNCVINLVEDKGRVFEEAYRVLRDGGRLSISDMVTDGPLPTSFRSDPAAWAGCVHGALPEAEYLDLVQQAGFKDVKTARSMSGGSIGGVQVYSLSVSARK